MNALALSQTSTRTERRPEVWQLADNATLKLRPRRGGLTLRGRHGTVLVTQAGDLGDHVLTAGDEFRTRSTGVVVVWALSDASVAAWAR